jgi:hypothetical protein
MDILSSCFLEKDRKVIAYECVDCPHLPQKKEQLMAGFCEQDNEES